MRSIPFKPEPNQESDVILLALSNGTWLSIPLFLLGVKA